MSKILAHPPSPSIDFHDKRGRVSIPWYVKYDVWEMTRGYCFYCGLIMNPFGGFIVDHVLPLCRGGSNSLTNLVPACMICNSEKGKRTLDEWQPNHAFWFLSEEYQRDHRDRHRRILWEWEVGRRTAESDRS